MVQHQKGVFLLFNSEPIRDKMNVIATVSRSQNLLHSEQCIKFHLANDVVGRKTAWLRKSYLGYPAMSKNEY
mgnify:CR=1 FL=1